MTKGHQVTDEDILAAKVRLTPAMERVRGQFRCPLCKQMYKVDGNCANDAIPLRRLPESEI